MNSNGVHFIPLHESTVHFSQYNKQTKKKTQDIDDLNYMINKFDLINRNLKFQNYILDKKD